MEKESSVAVSSIAKENEGHRDGGLFREYGSANVYTIVHATSNTAINCFQITTSDTHHTISARNDTPDGRVITPNKLKAKISEYNDLNGNQLDQLLAVLMKYRPNLTKRPGKCNGFEYHFQLDQLLAVLMKYRPNLTKRPGKCNGFEYHFNIVDKLPKSASSRTIQFALRDDVSAQIQDMLIDGILEESYSDYVNPSSSWYGLHFLNYNYAFTAT